MPLTESMLNPSGKSGETLHVAPGNWYGGTRLENCVLFNPYTTPSAASPNGVSSGPATQMRLPWGSYTSIGPSQIPSLSVSGLSGSVPVSVSPLAIPVFVSLTSSRPSPSSSRSSTKAGSLFEGGLSVSGLPSPSVSVSPAGSSGKASGPATQSGGEATGPSHIPSPSVSGLSGLVPISDSLVSESPSLSSSVSSTRPGASGLVGS